MAEKFNGRNHNSYKDLPNPPIDKTGWPWIVDDSKTIPERSSEKLSWPRITIVTPSFNQGEYIEETIRSVILQRYPNLEYIVIDGGSSDETVEILKKYNSWIDLWLSEPDKGQSHAINKGFALAGGDLLAWINSDDLLEKNALYHVAFAANENPGAIILGCVLNFNSEKGLSSVLKQKNVTIEYMLKPSDGSWRWHQPGTFVPASVQQETGPLDENLHHAFDKDWIFRLLQIAPVNYLDQIVARFRVHPEAKTSAGIDRWIKEIYQVNRRYLMALPATEGKRLKALYYLRIAGLHLVSHQEYRPFFNHHVGGMMLARARIAEPCVVLQREFFTLLARFLAPRTLWRSS